MEIAEHKLPELLECVNPVERLERIRGYLEAAKSNLILAKERRVR